MRLHVRDYENGRMASHFGDTIVATAHRIAGGRWIVQRGDSTVTVEEKRTAHRMLAGHVPGEIDPDVTVGMAVDCPVCGSRVGLDCRGPGVGALSTAAAVHVGRLKAALPAPRDAAHWWLDWHDGFVAGLVR